MKRKLGFFFLVACVFFVIATDLVAAEQRYRFGVFPHLPSRDLEQVYAPMAAEISAAVGKPVIFESSSSFENFNDRLDEETFDIVFVQPFDYVRIADAFGYTPLAVRGEPLFAAFTVKPDSLIHTVADLKGKTIALPSSISAVSRLIKSYLVENGIDPDNDVKILHRRSHTSCLQQVMINAADACGTAPPVQRFFENKMQIKLRSIGETKSIPHTLFAIHPRVNEQDKQKIIATILSWGTTEKGRKILERGQLTPFRTTSDSDYDVVREIVKRDSVKK